MIGVIGDVMIDEYVTGLSFRTSPEYKYAPVVSLQSKETFLGGAGNTALNIKHLGQDVTLFCAANNIGTVQQLLMSSELHSINSINKSDDIVKTRIYSNNIYLARLDKDTEVQHDEDYLVNELFKSTPKIIIISDYGKGTIKKPSKIIEQAYSRRIPTLVDSKSNLSDFKGAYLLKPNLTEFLEWMDIARDEDPINNLNKLNKAVLSYAINTLKVDNLIITLGEYGCIHVTKSIIKMYSSPAVPVKDVTGAGDSFIAGLAVALATDKTMEDAIVFANKVASVCVTKKGTQYVKYNEI